MVLYPGINYKLPTWHQLIFNFFFFWQGVYPGRFLFFSVSNIGTLCDWSTFTTPRIIFRYDLPCID